MNIGIHKQKRSVSYSRARFRLIITKRQMTIIMSSQQWFAMCAALMFGLLTVTVEARGQLNARQEDAVQSAFEQMLGLSAPPSHNGGDVSHVSGHVRAPRHMLELYERYTRSRKTTGETIRSILPLPDTTISNIAVSDLLLFNVSCLLESRHSEEVTNARLHVRRRRWMAPRHAYHGGSGGQMLAPPARIRVYRVTQTQAKVKMVALASIPVLQATKGGWHSLDITSAVRELLLTSPPHSHTTNVTLAVRFDSPRGRPIPPDNFLLLDDRQQSAAFLVVFCRDDDQHDNELVDDDVEGRRKTIDISAEHAEIMADLLSNAALSAKQVNNKKDVDNSGKQRHQVHYFKKNVYANKKRTSKIRNSKKYKNKPLILIETSSAADGDINELVSMRNMKAFNKRHHRSGNNLNVRYDETSDKAISNVKSERSNHVMEHNILDDGSTKRVLRSSDDDDNKRRSVRSIEDNELPDTDLIYFDEKTMLSKIPLEVMKPTEGEDTNTIPYPTGSEKKSRRRGRKGRKRGNKNKRHRKLPEDWDYWKKGNSEESEEHDISTTMTQTNATNNSSFAAAAILQTCHRRRLTVDFYDIGWSDWIIAPESFDAHYCTGRCPFPLAETLKPTNHAIIQSLVHAIGRQMGVPALCCVPDAMSPMPLLYIDEAGNAVLKNYPSMTVDTCACR